VNIMTVGGDVLLTREAFLDAARRYFGEAATEVEDTAAVHSDVTLHVSPPGGPGFTVDHDVDASSVRTDGTPEQAAAVAAWVRSLLPAEFPRVIASDPGWSWHVELVHGITADRVLSEQVSHADPAWAQDDPDLG